ncbi:peptidoglycan-associated lipoprotein Pal [Undibacterium sp. FT147W]|uniref:Peptidoglycan-associated lipoprotein n=1 Tax=Undibacterium rivi TaxID=2828729 RepID=A0ABS5H0A8_9BURK|nr:peptidoglycan-associated lipoprotein Pal [Undibacterium rivi]MBR7792146.1 peptidoglycan-associated lipoprotein Pal [Undibacterium rivi]
MNIAKSLACIGAVGFLLSACSSTPTKPVEQKPVPTPMAAKPVATAPAQALIPEYLDPNSPIFKERSVYFDFDNYTVKSDYTALIERQGKYLATHPQLSIKVEGNADERGGAEYNLALGQKRAEAVVRALKVYGVKESQMEAISWGKEKPKASGHDEAAWAQNRRVDLSYPQK